MDDILFSDLDRAFADFLVERSALSPGKRERLWNLVAGLSRALGEGHSCLPLSPADQELLHGLPSVGDGRTATPLVLYRGLLYLQRYFHYERHLASAIAILASANLLATGEGMEAIQAGFLSGQDEAQLRAVAMAAGQALTIICGGPGTGKTTTVVAILARLMVTSSEGRLPTVALAAPTGKAAMRLGEAVGKSLTHLSIPEEARWAIPTTAATLHRLLGVRRGSPRFVHNHDNPLGWDIVVVDEASMVDLALMSKLVDAIKPGGRLILLGDKDQLASVESGAVLADLVKHLPENTVELTTTYRFDQGIKNLAEAIKTGNGERAWQLLRQGQEGSATLLEKDQLDSLARRYDEIFFALQAAAAPDPGWVLAALNRFRILCALQHGRRGVATVNHQVELALAARGFAVRPGNWYPGRPVLITRNDYGLGLFNGDIGVCLRQVGSGELRVWFERAEGGLRSFTPTRLPDCQTVYAMTIHKSQGSEFEEVAVLLPENHSRVLGRELLYTGVTRAKKKVSVLAEEEILRFTIAKTVERHGGLGNWLRGFAGDKGQEASLPERSS